jgi:transposase
VARHASAILAWDEGLPTREIVARTGLSAGRVRYWVRTFRSQRMAIFHGVAGEEREPEAQPPGTAEALTEGQAVVATSWPVSQDGKSLIPA